ncbi:MAG: hypothetical protein EZS28_020251 [Streblomastix strix]|uniref:Uncharacterized protein n=1 Tax=Streblomastix strix TaxID=222440 RepID=A0A5J4VNR6_9EUKA|nr:MAG: hypothetical protein EZS28_020251 [Streblomastix strix]
MTFTQSEVVLHRDSSIRGWNGTVTNVATKKQIKIGRKWKGRWRLISSNKWKLAANLCGIRFMERGSAANDFARILDKILLIAKNRKMYISAMDIPGKGSKVAESLLKLTMSRDYQIRRDILVDALQQLEMRPSEGVFANGLNRQFGRFNCLITDSWSIGQDGLTKNKTIDVKIKRVIIIPHLTSKSWQLDFQKLKVKMIVLGYCKQNFILGGRMKKKQLHLSP